MPAFIFQQAEMAWFFLFVPLLVVVFLYRLKKQRQDMNAFGAEGKTRETKYISLEPWRLAVLVSAVVMIILGLMRPAINPHPKMIPREGRDVVFLLDVSNSMLAEDRLPNRLLSAKDSIRECVASLQDHRVGLVVFAGSSSIVCPLTLDTDFFLNSLEKVGPSSVAHGGTRIGDALLKISDKLFSADDLGYKDIVLLTDGGDQSDGVERAIEELNKKQIRLIVIGLGDMNHGARIPMEKSENQLSDYMLYKGEVVWSKLDGALLSKMVKECDHGAYIPVGTRQMRLDQIYQRLSQVGGTQQLAEQSVIAYDDIFPWFLGGGFLLLVVMIFIPHTKLRSMNGKNRRSGNALLLFMMIHCLVLFSSGSVWAKSSVLSESGAHEEYVKGNQFYRNAQYADAAQSYESALEKHPSGAFIRDVTYNLGNAYYKASKKAKTPYDALALVNKSIEMYRRVLIDNRNDLDAAINNEIVRAERRKLERQIKAEEKRRQEMQLALDEIRKKLLVLIEQQASLLPKDETSKEASPPSWGKEEQRVADGTDVVSGLLRKMNEKFFPEVPRDLTPVAESKKHVAKAFLSQKEAILIYRVNWEQAKNYGQISLKALQDALAALPQQADGQGQSSDDAQEGDSDDQKQMSDDGNPANGDQGDSDEGDQGDQEAAGATKVDLKSMELPPPTNSPEDVIRRSREQQGSRQAGGKGRKGKPVDKDW